MSSHTPPFLDDDEKRFFWATLNINNKAVAPTEEIVWAAEFLAIRNMTDHEFSKFMLKIKEYTEFVLNNRHKVQMPVWATPLQKPYTKASML